MYTDVKLSYMHWALGYRVKGSVSKFHSALVADY